MSQFEQITDANVLVKSFRDCKKGVNWKTSVQRYDANLLMNIYALQQRLKSKTYDMSAPFEFDKLDEGKMTLEDVHNSYLSWRGSVERYDNHFRLSKINNYFKSILTLEV